MKAGLAFSVVCVGALLVAASAGHASTIPVTNTNDSGPGSLRQAIASANPGDTITVPPGMYTLTSGALLVNKQLTITGAGAATTTLSGNDTSRVFVFTGAGAVTVSSVTVTHGVVASPAGTAQGGGIASDAGTDLTLQDVVVTGNVADASGASGQSGGLAQGGGIYHTGNLTVSDSDISGNSSKSIGATGKNGGVAQGGGIFDNASSSHSLVLNNVMLDSNTADASGGSGGVAGIAEGGSLENNNDAAPMTLSGVTISRSKAISDGSGTGSAGISGGGGMQSRGAAALTNVTISSNSTDSSVTGSGNASSALGGGLLTSFTTTVVNSTVVGNTSMAAGPSGSPVGGNVAQAFGTLTLKNSIVASGSAKAGSENCSGTITSGGHNIDSLDQCGFHSTGDRVSTNPQLGPLTLDGGSLETAALLAGSPAINAADNAGCPTSDARGVARPQQGSCDIGAYEFGPPAVITAGATNVSQTRATITGSVTPNLRDTTYHFDFGQTATYGSQSITVNAGAGNSSLPASATLNALKPGVTYHYRITAVNADGPSVGPDQTFSTLPTPLIGSLSIKPRAFRAAAKGPSAKTTRKARKRSAGAKVRFRLNTPATVAFRVQAARPGRRARNGRCVAPTKRNRHARSCKRFKTLPGSFRVAGKAGTTTFRFTGRLKGKRLRPGNYRLVGTPSAGGVTGTKKRASFRIIK